MNSAIATLLTITFIVATPPRFESLATRGVSTLPPLLIFVFPILSKIVLNRPGIAGNRAL